MAKHEVSIPMGYVNKNVIHLTTYSVKLPQQIPYKSFV